MPNLVELSGRYRIVDHVHVYDKACNTNDASQPFYDAMLRHRTFKDYLSAVGDREINKPNFKANPITGRGEMLYALRNDWIARES